MAPSRRKGGSRASAAAAAARRQWKVGDLVLAKVKGFPAWPATVSEPEKWGYSSDGKKVLVYFFGTQQIAFSNPIDVEPFTEERKESLLTKRHGKGADFIRAVHEIIDSYEQLKKGQVACNSVDNVTQKNSGISKDNLGLQNESPDMELSSCEKTPLSVEDSVGIIRESDNLHDLETTRAPKAKNQGNTYFSRKRFRGVQLNSCPSLKKVTAPRSSRSGKCILSPSNDSKAATDMPASVLRDGTRSNRTCESSNVNEEERDPNAMPLNGSSKENGSEYLTVSSGCKLQQIEHALENGHETELNQMPVLVAEAVIVRKKRNRSRKRATMDPSDAVSKVAEDRGSEVEVLRAGQDFPDVRLVLPDKGDGDEHLPLVKRARVRLGRSSSKKEDQNISTLLEEKVSVILNKAPEHVCASLTHDVDCNVDSKSHVTRYDECDSVLPKSGSQFAVEQLQALDGRGNAKLGCLVDGEATLPPSKRLHRALEAMSANAAESTNTDASLSTKACIYGSYANKESPEIFAGGEKKCPAMENIDLSNMNASQGTSTMVSTSSELPLLEEMAYCSGEEVRFCKLVSKNDNQNKEFCEDRALEILESVDMKSVSLPSLGESTDKLLGCNGGSFEPLSPSKRGGQDENMGNHHKIEKPLENLESVNLKRLSLPSLGDSMDKLLDNDHKVEKPPENLESVDENMDNHHKIVRSWENLDSVDMKSLSFPSLGESMDKLLGCNEASLESLSPSKCIGQYETLDNHHKIEKPLREHTLHDCEIVSNSGLGDGEIAEELPGESNIPATRPSNSPVTVIKEANKVFHATGDIKQTLKDSNVITSPSTLKDIEAAECLQNLSGSASISLDHTGDRDISGQGSSSSMTNKLGSMACESPPSTSICNDYTLENDRIVDNTGCWLLTSRLPLLKPKDTNKWSSKTEASAALASFEAALRTLTRTKENITGATRIAIDCAKHGNASKVVEIIAHNLESEPNLHRRVDLFFLVDSIAQCSRGLKGEVGGIYPSAIQESLKRLLLAAAPPGSSTLENCRQCLKVLRLWLERRILPDSIIRCHIRELESLCCSSSGSVFAKRTMRTERPFDDPIRGMDGMLVDEYGSNSNFKLAGFCMPPMLKDEDEDEDEDDGSDSDGGDFEAVTPEHECKSHKDREIILPATTVVKHTCVLEEVDGELEMEDVSPNCDAERTFISNSVLCPSNVVHQFDNNIPLPFIPPLPVDMPPSSPPLPTSPPPPPASSIPVPFDSKIYVGAHNMSAVNPEALPFHTHEHRENQMQPSVQGVCTAGVFNGQPIPNIHVQHHVNGIQENNGNSVHNATYPMHSLQPAPSNQFSYIQSDQWLQSQREVPCTYPGPVGGNFCNDFDRRNIGPHENGGSNWRFSGPPITGGSYALHYPGPVCDPPNEPNHGWGFPQWNGNHQDFMPHRPPAEGPMPVPIRAPCFWQPR